KNQKRFRNGEGIFICLCWVFRSTILLGRNASDFRNFRKAKGQEAKFLILTGNLEFAESKIPADLKEFIVLKKVNSEEVPSYLNAADLGFALRQPKFSMQGVAPIKLGEYLLCGLPVIA